eukprot:scaffold28135_cov16-Tisochrysis_lutea.AAC.3
MKGSRRRWLLGPGVEVAVPRHQANSLVAAVPTHGHANAVRTAAYATKSLSFVCRESGASATAQAASAQARSNEANAVRTAAYAAGVSFLYRENVGEVHQHRTAATR